MLSLGHINQDLQTESAIAVLSSDIRRFDVGGWGGVGWWGESKKTRKDYKKKNP